MKAIFILICFFSLTSHVAEAKLNPVWELTKDISQPESVYYEPTEKLLYISNIAGDEKGWISKADLNGQIINSKWFTGLDDPKGMRSFEDTLYVTDNHRVIGINLKNAKKVLEVNIENSGMLNDLVVDNLGGIYVSDSMANKIYYIKGNQWEVFDEGEHLHSPNGLLIDGDDLVVASWGDGIKPDWSTDTLGSLYKINLTSKKTQMLAKEIGHLDGLEKSPNHKNKYYVSDYVEGRVYSVTENGILSVGTSGLKGAADIAFVSFNNPQSDLIVIPSMNENRIVAISASNAHEVLERDLISLEGVYNLQTIYVNNNNESLYVKLDRLTLIRETTDLSITLALSDYQGGGTFIFFSNCKINFNPEQNEIRITAEGEGLAGVYGQIELAFNTISGEFTGVFFDSLAPGYKKLSGSKTECIGSILNPPGNYSFPSISEVAGVYEGNLYGQKRQLILRTYSSGNISAVFATNGNTSGDPWFRYQTGVYSQRLGLLEFVSIRNDQKGTLQKFAFTIRPSSKEGPSQLTGLHYSTSGKYEKSTFTRVGEVETP